MRITGSRVPPNGASSHTDRRALDHQPNGIGKFRVISGWSPTSTVAQRARGAAGTIESESKSESARTGGATRILITDTVALNTGDAAVLLGTIRTIRAAFGEGVDIEVADLQPKAAARYYPEIRFIPTIHGRLAAWAGESGLRYKLGALMVVAAAATSRFKIAAPIRNMLPDDLRDVVLRYAAADVIIAAGGTYLVPHYRLAPRLVNFLCSVVMGKPLILFTQSMGPFPGGFSNFVLRKILRRSALILLRDDLSRRHLQALGVPATHVALSPDAAFALAPATIPDLPVRKTSDPLRVAISLRDWPHFDGMEAYLDAVAGLVRDLVERRHAHVTFLSTCQGATEYWTDDSVIADQVTRRLAPEILRHIEVDRMHRRPENLIRRIKDFDAVVATRMHAAILSLCAGRPVLAVAYEFKSRELFRRFDLSDLVVDIENVSSETLISTMDHLLSARTSLMINIAKRVAAERQAALATGSLLRRAVLDAGVPAWHTR
jgi:colanic acid/amylovoran biosynthesis protein